jgi:hypothetical protein
MNIYYITEEELRSLHQQALESNSNASYREGYLDSFNRFKILLKQSHYIDIPENEFPNGLKPATPDCGFEGCDSYKWDHVCRCQ